MEFILGGAAAPPEAAVFSGRAPPGQGNIVYIDTQPRAPDFGHLKGNTKLAAELESVIAKGWADRDKAKTELVEALRRAQVSTVSDVVELMHTATEEDARRLQWKVQQYSLTMAVPNELALDVAATIRQSSPSSSSST